MYEDAQEIFEYLPIRRNEAENEYINQLQDTFELLEKSNRLWSKDKNGFAVLDEKLINARPFALMPFHLLFMMAIQYKVLRISDINNIATNLFFSTDGGRYKNKLLSENKSVFDLSNIKERTLPEVFQLIGLSNNKILEIKDLIDKRNNNLAHANGNSTSINLENSIGEYLNLIRVIQELFLQANGELADKLILEVKSDDDMGEFIEEYLLNHRLNMRDFSDLIDRILESEKLNHEQWEQVVSKGLELSYEKTVQKLKSLEILVKDENRRERIAEILYANGEESTILTYDEAQDLGIF